MRPLRAAIAALAFANGLFMGLIAIELLARYVLPVIMQSSSHAPSRGLEHLGLAVALAATSLFLGLACLSAAVMYGVLARRNWAAWLARLLAVAMLSLGWSQRVGSSEWIMGFGGAAAFLALLLLPATRRALGPA